MTGFISRIAGLVKYVDTMACQHTQRAIVPRPSSLLRFEPPCPTGRRCCAEAMIGSTGWLTQMQSLVYNQTRGAVCGESKLVAEACEPTLTSPRYGQDACGERCATARAVSGRFKAPASSISTSRGQFGFSGVAKREISFS